MSEDLTSIHVTQHVHERPRITCVDTNQELIHLINSRDRGALLLRGLRDIFLQVKKTYRSVRAKMIAKESHFCKSSDPSLRN